MSAPTTSLRTPAAAPSTIRGRADAAGPGRGPAGLWALTEARWAAAAAGLFVLGLLAQLTGAPTPMVWAMYLSCYAAGGWGPALSGLQALRERTLDVDLLMVVAAIGAASIGQVLDGALLIVIFSASGAVEAFATARTAASVQALLTLAPDTATLETPDGEQVVHAAAVGVGDVVVVRPGERIGADGVVVDGASDVDQAGITGEPLPVHRGPGDEVFAGTMNGTGTLRVRATRPAADTVVARIVALVEQARETKAPTQLLIERVEQRYSVAMVSVTVALLAVPLALGAAFEPTLLRAMTFMIVASPCAIVLATMPPLLAAMATCSRHGVLVTSAVVMEQLGQSTLVAFDKTGTLTEGAPRMALVHADPAAGLGADRLLALAAAAEQGSEHPVGRAVVAAARERGLVVPAASGFDSAPGRGVHATVEGQRVEVGSPAALDEAGLADVVDQAEQRGHTTVVVRLDGRPVGVLGLSDRPRPRAAEAVASCRRVTGTGPVLLTGDNPRAAADLAATVGIDRVQAGLLPADKLTAVERLQRDGHRVLLVGDGVNDAPALAGAHLGLAMGGAGSDVALETADAVLVSDDLTAVPAAVALSRRARRLVLFNLGFAAITIVALLTWGIVADLPLPLAVAGHEGSTVLVALNGMRLLRDKAWTRAEAIGAV